MKKKVLIYEEYIIQHDKYTEKYGKVCVLMQCGDFYEIYGYEGEGKKLGDIYTIAMAAGLNVGEKTNKWLMAGFQPPYIDKYLPRLLDNQYTIVVMEQSLIPTATNKPKFERKVTRIISPSTYIPDGDYSAATKGKYTGNKTLMTVYVEFKKNMDIFSVSMSSMDLSLGKSTFYTISNANSPETCINESFRFIHSVCPIEIIFYVEKEKHIQPCKSFINLLSIDGLVSKYDILLISPDYLKPAFLQAFLCKFFNIGPLKILDYLGIAKYQSLGVAYALLLDFAYEHDETITKHTSIPTFWKQSNFLTIENNGIYQLNVVKTHNINKSLIDILDYTSTNMGKRLHVQRLLNPIVNVKMLNERYDQIEWMINEKRYERYKLPLQNIYDVEKIHRKIENGTINLNNFIMLDRSYNEISKLMESFTLEIEPPFVVWNVTLYNEFKTWRDTYNIIFIFSSEKTKCSKINLSPFNKGIDDEIDVIQEQICEKINIIYDVADILAKCIVTTGGQIKVEFNEKDGFYFSTTNKRADLIKKHMAENKNCLGKYSKKWIDFKYTKLSTITKIRCAYLDEISKDIEKKREQLDIKCQLLFAKKIQEFHKNYRELFTRVSQFVSEIDWTVSCAEAASVNFYCKPIIKNMNGTSFLQAQAIRHPIIETMLSECHYIPNDITLGIDEKGILLFGDNGSGKSSLMKSVAVDVIMAQCGMYVPCDTFTYYPFANIITRITSEDNYSKGYSSFAVEMIELKTILDRSNQNTLVIGDEVCHGTEYNSALAIFTQTILELITTNCTFLFATHLHKLGEMHCIRDAKTIKCYHLDVTNDEQNDCLVYHRKIKEGIGNSLYGLEAAKHIFKDRPDFIKKCLATRRQILEIPDKLFSGQPSNYNAKLIVHDCKICGKKAVDTHHINFQCTANDEGTIEIYDLKFHKNKLANLVPLCKYCHIKVHHSIDGKMYVINRYNSTSKGVVLDWKEIIL